MADSADALANAQPAPIALITGASSGLGAALAAEYARRGWRLVLVARRADALEQTARDCGVSGDAQRLRLLVCDVRDIDRFRQEADRLLQDWGCPQVVIANAGISHGVDLSHPGDLDMAIDIMDINWGAALGTLAPFIAPMRSRGSGALVGIASVAGLRGLPCHAAYCASKAALIRSLESLRVELRAHGVKVVTISPGYVETAMTAGNRFAMPFLLSPRQFTVRAVRAIDAGRAYATIPWQMAVLSQLLRVVPRALYDRAVNFYGRKPRKPDCEPCRGVSRRNRLLQRRWRGREE
ncbi:putative oxidoreductase [mine drainage metagenome]|uniref:Putative oxidoreductase n=1 Tax=mine drainage metagenome TaxID=410659 RepID=A0A1J5PKJ5_9ZZZZ